IQLLVLLGHFQRLARNVERRYMLTDPCQMQRESALIAAHIQGFASSKLCCCCVIFALVQKCSRLLSALSVVEEPDTVHGESSRTFVAGDNLRLKLRKLLQLADAFVHTFHNVL